MPTHHKLPWSADNLVPQVVPVFRTYVNNDTNEVFCPLPEFNSDLASSSAQLRERVKLCKCNISSQLTNKSNCINNMTDDVVVVMNEMGKSI